MRIPSVERCELPSQLPSESSMRSWGQNFHNYDPEVWDLEYISLRYLEDLYDEDLFARHKHIIKNLIHIASEQRDIIPSVSPLSSWYWYRKEHQTRVEMALRGLDASAPKNLGMVEDTSRPACPIGFPNGTNLLLKFGEHKHMKNMILYGEIKFSPARYFEDTYIEKARHDIEYEKSVFTPGSRVRIIDPRGNESPIIGSLKTTYSGPFYHMACFTCEWQCTMFSDFNANSCVMITDPEEFFRRIYNAKEAQYAGWHFHHNPIQYYDPYEIYRDTYVSQAMSKDFKFSYQKEYRVIFSNHKNSDAPDWQILRIGNCRDIMQLFDDKGNPIKV
jgi:hypothetical protein